MIKIEVPGREIYEFNSLILDMNGTIAVDGIIPEEVIKLLETLSHNLKIYIITADTHGKLESQRDRIAAEITRVTPPGEAFQKAEFISKLGASNCIAIGNGSNDVEMLKKAKLAIAVIGREGCAVEALSAADIVVNEPADALDLLINQKRIIATLRR